MATKTIYNPIKQNGEWALLSVETDRRKGSYKSRYEYYVRDMLGNERHVGWVLLIDGQWEAYLASDCFRTNEPGSTASWSSEWPASSPARASSWTAPRTDATPKSR